MTQHDLKHAMITLNHIILMLDVMDEYISQHRLEEMTEYGWTYTQALLFITCNELKQINATLEQIEEQGV